MRLNRTSLLAGVAFAALAAGAVFMGSSDGLIGPRHAQAQNLGQRSVSGAVVDAESLGAGHHRTSLGACDADPHLEPAGVGRLVAPFRARSD